VDAALRDYGGSQLSDLLVLKFLTNDPNLVINWIVDNQGD